MKGEDIMSNRSVMLAVVFLAGLLLAGSLFITAGSAYAQGAYSDKDLALGTYGEDVRQVQQCLSHLNYNTGGIDGIYGPQTVSAVSAFQKDQQLVVDGIAGPETQWALFKIVSQLQKDLTFVGFDTKGVDGCFGPATVSAVLSFQTANKLKADGIVGPETKKALEQAVAAKKANTSATVVYIVQKGDTLSEIAVRYKTTVKAIKDANKLSSDLIKVGQKLVIPSGGSTPTVPSTSTTPSRQGRFGELVPWSEAQKIFKVGMIATITDFDTGLTYQVKRLGGSNHADVEPLTAADTAKMKQAYHGEWSWERHAILVTVAGRTIAASQNGMPHGTSTIDNNFPGHFCIHFLGSMTHGNNQWAPSPAHVDAAHQAMVRKAAGLSS
ncbi:Peptidoglycan-binding lysin domain protein [Syntrophothermus lipocalidus DSM 12680]|uniref:Peptidoglycan-binding lysin domain protein n=2 Tax=Syntrophothermus TaxID=129001 RepID=D7CNU8_SYNLT|nr:Peptidoglycan-binding lysin domain protein [Syntrophothermus lipocalidus DSM 12680]